MNENYKLFQKYLSEFYSGIPRDKVSLLYDYLTLLLKSNQEINLTSIIDWREAVIKHLLDSLAITGTNWWRDSVKVMDVGTGAGFPGVPLAIVFPEKEVYLVESNNKKTDFLRRVKNELGLTSVFIISGRAEDIARQGRYRERFDLVLARAVAKLSSLLELTLPFCRIEGFFVAYKGPQSNAELAVSSNALRLLGGEFYSTFTYRLPENMGERNLLAFKKIGSTPENYPRRPGIPVKRPL